MARQFEALLFLGAGEFSLSERARLHRRLDEALDLSGGLQQSSQGEPESESERERLAQEVRDAARDLVAALTGRDISFGEVLEHRQRV